MSATFVEALKNGGAVVRMCARFVVGNGKRFVIACGGGVVGLVAMFVGAMKLVFNQCSRFVARAMSILFVAAGFC